jgi:hypothetical protein
MASPETQKALSEIERSSVEARWRMPKDAQGGPTVELLLPHKCFLGRNTFVRDERGLYIDAGTLRVTDPELRGNRIGERLSRALGALVQKYHYPKIVAAMASEYSLDIFGRVFGPGSMTFHGTDTTTGAPTVLAMDFADVRLTLQALGMAEPDPEHRNMSIETHVDVSTLNTDGWEMPRETTPEADFDWSLLQPEADSANE